DADEVFGGLFDDLDLGDLEPRGREPVLGTGEHPAVEEARTVVVATPPSLEIEALVVHPEPETSPSIPALVLTPDPA
ncbi:MAG: hypothetical protein KC620_12245, partial [Myxococcales bacterium]|nr:hypothetical protein [Myxococcales bacterium]